MLNYDRGKVKSNISEYALTNHDELFAESFVLYHEAHLRERLPAYIRGFFDKHLPRDGRLKFATLGELLKANDGSEKTKQVIAVADDFENGRSTIYYDDGTKEVHEAGDESDIDPDDEPAD